MRTLLRYSSFQSLITFQGDFEMEQIGDNISLDKEDDVSIVYISNNLSYQTADELRTAYEQIKDDDKILIDLGQVKITTSRGMATLISIILDGFEKGQLVYLCNVSRQCMNIIEAMNITKHVPELEIFDTINEGWNIFMTLKRLA